LVNSYRGDRGVKKNSATGLSQPLELGKGGAFDTVPGVFLCYIWSLSYRVIPDQIFALFKNPFSRGWDT